MNEYHNYFRLFAHGKNFDADNCVKTSPLIFDKIWHRGDLLAGFEFTKSTHPTSGIELCLGKGRELTIFEQDRIAADFLESNEESLKQLADYPGVDTFILGLHYRIKLDQSICGFSMSASQRLICLSLRIGIDVTFYVDLDREPTVDRVEPDESCNQSQRSRVRKRERSGEVL